MLRLLFEKTGNSVWISHLDLMRVFQRAFKRAGLPLTHTKGFNPRASVSIALPLSVGIESHCELLDFELDGVEVPLSEIMERLNAALISGVKILEVYKDARKLRDLAFLKCEVVMEYDKGVPQNACEQIGNLFTQESVIVEKKGKNGFTEQDIIPMIRSCEVICTDNHTITIAAIVCCQNPTLNPMQLNAAIEKYLPDLKADFVKCKRLEVFDTQNQVFR